MGVGLLSRVEETTSGLSLGISSNATWLAVAFAAGALRRRTIVPRAAAAGALALTAANASYYAWIAATEPGTELASVAGSPFVWLVLGAAGGAVFASAGHLWATQRAVVRVLAAVPLAGVCIADGITALTGGPAADAVGLAVGAALPIASAASAAQRALGAALAALLIAIALTGRLEALLP